jgi:hypothetical protein
MADWVSGAIECDALHYRNAINVGWQWEEAL